jgi:uncharacterized protein YndB with AHSA1/START domain
MADDAVAMHPTALAVRKSITVEVDRERAFEVFTAGVDSWWPREHHIGTATLDEMVIEPREGGRCYGRDADGEWEWGKVLAFEPPERVVFAWQLNAGWTFDPSFQTEVEVRFSEQGQSRTLVELEHRHLERYAEATEQVFAAFDSDGGWTSSLALFAAAAEKAV